MTEPHPLTEVTRGFPEWVRWMLHGIVLGSPLDADEVHRHVVDADPAPDLPHVPDLDGGTPVRLTELRLGAGCYGLAEGAVIEFGRRLTLIHGENGAGKSSLARILRAVVGRPSTQRPPHNSFTGVLGEATLRVERGGAIEEHRWRAGDGVAPPVHVEVFDSADTRVDGAEYQVRPRGVIALEDLRRGLDAVTIIVEPLVIPVGLRGVLTREDVRALDDPAAGVRVLTAWLADAASRPLVEVERDLAELGDETRPAPRRRRAGGQARRRGLPAGRSDRRPRAIGPRHTARHHRPR